MRIKLVIGYDGTDFCGWQVQPNKDTVQQQIENAVHQATGEKVRVTGSGRTDSGVHANGQVAHFDTACSSIPPERFFKALNVHLPPSIRVKSSERVADDFDACRTAKRKTYEYRVYTGETENPLKERYAVYLREKPCVETMQRASRLLIGEHDFKGFCATGSSIKTTVRTVYELSVIERDGEIVFSVTGNGFLYNMVRIIVGTLIKIGLGKATESHLTQMLNQGQRDLGGKTLPAKGLCLMNVQYE